MMHNLGVRLRPAEEVTLSSVTAELHHPIAHFEALDAFRGRAQPELMADVDNGFDESQVAGIDQHLGHEGAINLDPVELELTQIGQTRISGAKIVEGDADAEIAQRRKDGLRFV